MNPPLSLQVYLRYWGWKWRYTQYLIEFDQDAYIYHLGPFYFRWGFVKEALNAD